MPQAFLTPEAYSDFLEIWLYIAEDSSRAADNVFSTIERTIKALACSPRMGRERRELAPELRSFPVSRYVIFYRMKRKDIQIIRVLHGSRDIVAVFKEER